jgi:hypothetical protein
MVNKVLSLLAQKTDFSASSVGNAQGTAALNPNTKIVVQ